MIKCSYKTSNYKFYEEVQKGLGLSKDFNLNSLYINEEVYSGKTDQSSFYHKKWYESPKEEFLSIYKEFLKQEVESKVRVFWYGEKLVYQTKPTIRFHYPGNLAVGEYHRDRDYSHSPHEINVFLPITLAYGNNTMWIESEEGLEDYKPMNAGYGDFVLFNGSNLKHGNKLNDTPFCRISFDFRVIPFSKYEEWEKMEKVTNTGRKMVVGEYYSIL